MTDRALGSKEGEGETALTHTPEQQSAVVL
jgi:hypothetical protein